MRKLLILLCAALFLIACSDSKDSEVSKNSKISEDSKVSMDSIIQAFEKEGITIDPDEKPYFEIINAKDGVIFYNQDKVVKIYEFESAKDIKAAKEANVFMEDWPENDLFVLETSDEKSIEIFNNLK